MALGEVLARWRARAGSTGEFFVYAELWPPEGSRRAPSGV